jgi:hypothetical protein
MESTVPAEGRVTGGQAPNRAASSATPLGRCSGRIRPARSSRLMPCNALQSTSVAVPSPSPSTAASALKPERSSASASAWAKRASIGRPRPGPRRGSAACARPRAVRGHPTMVGVEFAVAVFVNPILLRLPVGSSIEARADGGRVLGRVMPFWYFASLILTAGLAVAATGGAATACTTRGWPSSSRRSCWRSSPPRSAEPPGSPNAWPGCQMLHSARVGDRRAARMAGSSPASAPMTTAAASPPAQAPGGMTTGSW